MQHECPIVSFLGEYLISWPALIVLASIGYLAIASRYAIVWTRANQAAYQEAKRTNELCWIPTRGPERINYSKEDPFLTDKVTPGTLAENLAVALFFVYVPLIMHVAKATWWAMKAPFHTWAFCLNRLCPPRLERADDDQQSEDQGQPCKEITR